MQTFHSLKSLSLSFWPWSLCIVWYVRHKCDTCMVLNCANISCRRTACSICDSLIPFITHTGLAVHVPRQSCVSSGSTLLITARSDETQCLRVRGEACRHDCTLCCWLGGNVSSVRVWMRRADQINVCTPAEAEMVESYGLFPGTMQPCAPGRMSNKTKRE